MTLEQKTMLREAIRYVAVVNRAMTCYDFSIAQENTIRAYGKLHELAMEVKMNGE